jgi:hypothetical protein
MSKRREDARTRITETAERYRQVLDEADALIAAGYAEPDGDVTPGLGAALAVRIERHADHDPSLICRPAGFGLCEIAPPDARLQGHVAAEES